MLPAVRRAAIRRRIRSPQCPFSFRNTNMPGYCNDARSLHPAIEHYGTTDPWIWSECSALECSALSPVSVALVE